MFGVSARTRAVPASGSGNHRPRAAMAGRPIDKDSPVPNRRLSLPPIDGRAFARAVARGVFGSNAPRGFERSPTLLALTGICRRRLARSLWRSIFHLTWLAPRVLAILGPTTVLARISTHSVLPEMRNGPHREMRAVPNPEDQSGLSTRLCSPVALSHVPHRCESVALACACCPVAAGVLGSCVPGAVLGVP